MRLRSRSSGSIVATLLFGGSLALLGGGIYLTLLGCGPSVPQFRTKPPRAQISQDQSSVLIEAQDRSFALRTGEIAQTPFWNACEVFPTANNFARHLETGARRVTIQHPGFAGKLYGVLSFCNVREDFKGPASRLYLVSVPQQYVDATADGNVAVVMEQYDVGGKTFAAWALWLSREPL